MFTGDFKMAIASLRASRWRTALTMLGIIIGVSSVVTIASLGEGLKHQIITQINQLGNNVLTVRSGKVVNKENGKINSINPLAFFGPGTITEQDVKDVSKIKGVKLVAPMSQVTNSISTADSELNNTYVIGTTPDMNHLLGKKLSYGAFFTDDEVRQNYAVIGSAIAEKLYKQLNPVGDKLIINGNEFIVHGVISGMEGGLLPTSGIDLNYAVFIPYETGKDITANKAQLTQMLVQTAPNQNIDTINEEIRHTLLSNHRGQEDFTILKQEDVLAVSNNVLNIATGFIAGIAAISLLVGGIGIMNIMLVSVSERTREIGIRKAIGASNRQILDQFLIEGTTISIGGGIIGILVAVLANYLLRIYTGFKPEITLPIVIIAAGVSIAIGIIFATIPAYKAAKKHPIEALRNE